MTGILRAFSAGKIDRRTVLGQWITERENMLARHCAFEHYSDTPPPLAGKIHLIIRNELFLAFYENDDPEKGIPPIRSAENLLSKLYTELGLERKAKPALTPKEYLKQVEQNRK